MHSLVSREEKNVLHTDVEGHHFGATSPHHLASLSARRLIFVQPACPSPEATFYMRTVTADFSHLCFDFLFLLKRHLAVPAHARIAHSGRKRLRGRRSSIRTRLSW